MIKKEIALIIFGVLIIGALIGFVSAASSLANDFGTMFDEFSGVISVFFSKILGESADSSMFFQRCLILLVVYGIIYTVLNRMSLFQGSSFLLFFTSAAVAVLGVKFLDADFIQAVLLPYAALGGSIAIFLPFLIYFMFVHTSVKGTFGRRAAWVVFALVFMAIYISKGFVSGEAGNDTTNWFGGMYIFGIILVICAFIFDSQIHMYFEYGKLGRTMSNFHQASYVTIVTELDKLEKARDAGMDTRTYHARKKVLMERLKEHASGM